MFERADASHCRLHRSSFSRCFRPSIHLLCTDSGVAYSSLPLDGLPAYGATAPSRPAQQTPQTLRSSIAWLALHIHFQPSLHGMHLPCYIGWTCQTSARSSSPFLLKFLRAMSTIQASANGLSSTSRRVVADATLAAEFIIHSFNQCRRRALL